MPDPAVAAAILTGGRSKRMGGAVKAHQLLGGHPLIRHVIDRVRPQVTRLVLSVERESEEYVCYGLDQVADPRPGSHGPLGGLLASISQLEGSEEWLLLAPCDAPFVPHNLAEKLKKHAMESGGDGCVVRYLSEVQPTFSIWNESLAPALGSAVLEEGMAGFKQFLRINPLPVLDWESSDISPFFNINDSADLAEAQQLSAKSQ